MRWFYRLIGLVNTPTGNEPRTFFTHVPFQLIPQKILDGHCKVNTCNCICSENNSIFGFRCYTWLETLKTLWLALIIFIKLPDTLVSKRISIGIHFMTGFARAKVHIMHRQTASRKEINIVHGRTAVAHM